MPTSHATADFTEADWNTIRMALESSVSTDDDPDPEWDREADDLYRKLQEMGLI
jgi:hypothetical protein